MTSRPRPDLPRCLRCGRLVPRRRRLGDHAGPRRCTAVDYCTERCARRQEAEDRASAAQERELAAEAT